MFKLWAWLSGKKTYLAAAGLFCYGLYDVIDGNATQGWHKIMEALAVFGLRNALSSESEK